MGGTYYEGRRWGGHPTRRPPPPAPATISQPNTSHKASLLPVRISFPYSRYQKNLFFAVRSRNPRPLYHSGSTRQRPTRQPRAKKRQSPRMLCDAFSRAGNVSIAERIKTSQIATSRHCGHIPNTQANPQKQAQPSPALPASNDTVCPSIAAPTANANGHRIKLAVNVLLLLRTGTIYGSLNPCLACEVLAGDSHPRLTNPAGYGEMKR